MIIILCKWSFRPAPRLPEESLQAVLDLANQSLKTSSVEII